MLIGALLLFYDILSSIITAVPHYQFLSDGIFPALATIFACLRVMDFFDVKKFVDMMDKGEFLSIPVIMAALNKTDKGAYDKVMKSHIALLKTRTKEYENTIKTTRQKAIAEYKHSGKLQFNVQEMNEKLYSDQQFLKTIERIESGDYSWEQFFRDIKKDSGVWCVIRYLLDRAPEDEKVKIDSTISQIKNLTNGGMTFKVKDDDGEWQV